MRADFLNSLVDPELVAEVAKGLPPIDPNSPQRFFNRELSWLAFNWRVLEEAENPNQPLMERVRFLSISANNLDEFYMVRVAGLRGLVRSGVKTRSIDGRTPDEQLRAIDADARRLMDKQQALWSQLTNQLAESGVQIADAKHLSKADRTFLDDHFTKQVFPVLTPLAIDPAHPFPFIPNKGFALALQLRPTAGGQCMEALIPIPSQISRFIPLPGAEPSMNAAGEYETPPKLRFFPLESLIDLYLDQLFPGYEVAGQIPFRVLRDSDIEIEEEAEDLVAMFELALKRRRRGEVIRLKMSSRAPSKLAKRLVRALEVDRHEVIEVDGLIGMSDVDQIIEGDRRPDLCWTPYAQRTPERLRDFGGDVFAAIADKDILIHHPYESFEIVVRFLQQAAQDPNVIAIRQTLYRTSQQSAIVQALCEAAEEGKSVTALVELKARFDEAANIQLARQLERAGVQVVFGFVDLKTHAKMSTVVRRERGKLITYSHFGTGNYHPITAKIYTDLSLFTCDAALGRDTTRLFNYIGSYSEPAKMEQLTYAPVTLKKTILENLEAEAANAKAGKPAQVWAKMNSVIEPEVVDALYAAGQAGVKIDLVVRGICGLRPGVPGLSENIRVKSIVGRFLEHSRICCFANGAPLPSDQAKVYISSADWMDRNLNRRIETMAPILNSTVRAQILEQVMAANLADEAHSWVLGPDGSFTRATPADPENPFNVHEFFMSNASLSGRGERGTEDAPRLRPAYLGHTAPEQPKSATSQAGASAKASLTAAE
ncbi:MAG: RNA degradosome polyphosphate kinase [Rhodobacteraceae bacterium]|nr:RNA degradosome polyphosphate kinase [Paracoccaceae bacterium]